MKKFFRIIALLEGLSYLILLFIGTPMKYIFGNDILVKTLGMPHGILFVLYCVLVLFLRSDYRWNVKDTLIMLILSVLPFGTFYADKKYLK
jgi:integral membrane protein